MNLPNSQAARFLADLQSRGVHCTLGKDPLLENGVRLTETKVLLSGGRMLPGDFDKVKRFKAGLIALLKPESAGDFMQCPDALIWTADSTTVTPVNHSAPRQLSMGMESLKEPKRFGDNNRIPVITPKKAVAPTKPSTKVPNWAKPLVKPQLENEGRSRNQTKVQVGDRYGLWEVVERIAIRTRYEPTRWLCRCDCGTIRPVYGGALLRTKGPSRSCGCAVKKKPKTDWSALDYTRKDEEIADELSCTASRVRVYRRIFAPETVRRKPKKKGAK